MSKHYNPLNWYWIVDGDQTHVYSSSAGDYVSTTDQTYLDWEAAGGIPTRITGPDMLLLRIDFLEAKITPRRYREAALGTDGGWLSSLDRQIATLRAQLV